MGRVLFILAVVAIVLLAAGVVAREAGAHNTGHLPDKNGDGVVKVFKHRSIGNLHGGWREYMVKANRQMRERMPDAPRLRRVFSTRDADVIITRQRDWKNCAGQFNRSSLRDYHYIYVGGSCTPGPKWFSHEMGHGYGEQHHDCTEYWHKRTASVAQLDENGKLTGGCRVAINGFGSHDIKFLQQALLEDSTFRASSHDHDMDTDSPIEVLPEE